MAHPRYAKPYWHKGLVLEFTGKNDEALELSEKAISLDFAASYYTKISILFLAVPPPRLLPLANHPRYNAVTYRTLPLTPLHRLSSSHISLASPAAADSVPMLSQPLSLAQP